jgi:hypothetical protein
MTPQSVEEEGAIAKEVSFLWEILCSGSQGRGKAEGLQEGFLQEGSEAYFPARLVPEEPRLF